MDIVKADVAIVGAGGAGLRAAIAVAESAPDLDVALISKVYPMRSHTVAAEGGAAGVYRDDDSLYKHFVDTVAGGDWLCEQDVVDFFVDRAPRELYQLEHWGCPWSRQPDGRINVRPFGGMKVPRTWFAADRTGFHMLHTLFQTSIKYSHIHRLDEHFALDLIVHDNQVQGVLTFDIQNGIPRLVLAKSVVIATGGSSRCYKFNTNGGIVTGDGMALAYRHGAKLRDMEFVQYHPTGLPGCGVLMTEACRGEGGVLTNKDGYRYLQDYGLGPETPLGHPKSKYMELGPRDRVSQAFWQEKKKGRTIKTPLGDVVNLDLRHLGEKYLHERLPFICELAKAYVGLDPVDAPIPVCPTVHYTMGGIETDGKTACTIKGLYAAGECASVGIHGANRLGSNSLVETVVFGHVAGDEAAKFSREVDFADQNKTEKEAEDLYAASRSIIGAKDHDENMGRIRAEMGQTMDDGVGIYRDDASIRATIAKLAELKARYKKVKVSDDSNVFNTEWLNAVELGFLLDNAYAMAYSALNRTESRGSHQRLDYTERDDKKFLAHSLATYNGDDAPTITYGSVKITKLKPAKRVYGAEGEKAEAAAKAAAEAEAAKEGK